MYTLTGSVGYGGKNDWQDVAFVQFALRYLSEQKNVPIDGNYSKKLGTVIWYAFNQKLPGGMHGHASKDEIVITGLKGISKLIPQKYQSYNFHIFRVAGRIKIFLEAKSATVSGSDKHSFPLQKPEAKELLLIQKRLLSKFGVLAKIAKMTAGSDGKIKVDLDIAGGRLLNLQTLAIEEKKEGKPDKRILDFLFKGKTSPLNSGQSVWTISSKKNVVLSTMRVNKSLIVPERTKSWILKSLGLKKSNFPPGFDVVKHAYAAYESARFTKELSADQEKNLVAYFGTDKDAILANVAARQLRCRAQYKALEQFHEKLKYAIEDTVVMQTRVVRLMAEMGAIESSVAEVYIGFLSDLFVGRAASSGISYGKKTYSLASKSNRVYRRENSVGEAARKKGVIVGAADSLMRNPPAGDMNVADWVVLIAGGAGAVIGLVFASGPIAVAGIIAAVVGSVVSLVDGLHDVMVKFPEHKQKVFTAQMKEAAAKNKLENIKDEINVLMATMETEGCFTTPADYYFLEGGPKEEIRASLPAFYKRIAAN